MEYNFQQIEQDSKKRWEAQQVYKVNNTSSRPKYYVLDMFPYPSGAGLHVGHPLGYIASDIFARYKVMKGFSVLHPMGFDAFGLPAEQYALETGQHPAVTTEKNITRYKEQLDNIGFNYDWSREVNTSDPQYYKWTQWIFLQLFKSWFNRDTQKAESLDTLIAIFEKEGNAGHAAPGNDTGTFTAEAWQAMGESDRRHILMQYRLAYLDHAVVWWCEALGTVLANDEVVNGVSERGGHPVERKKMRQWFLRITEYADRLIDSLDKLEWSEAMKEMQRNWIGRSEGAELSFTTTGGQKIAVFTTRPDTIFGVDFLVLAPEHELVSAITTPEHQAEVTQYVTYVKSRSERERMAEKKISGCFTGAYCLHPLSGRKIPVWISEYVLAGYGTGAIMAVPAGDDRDHAFARHFDIPVTNIFGDLYTGEAAVSDKNVTITDSDFISGLSVKDAAAKVLETLEAKSLGTRRINYRLRDAGFSRQRYWGEPFPIAYKDNVPYAIDEEALNLPEPMRRLPLELPHVEHYKPGPEGEGPLANVTDWVLVTNNDGEIVKRETNTMPGYAGSSWYFLRYMDPGNQQEFASKDSTDYWNQVDLYIGGTEHAVGHLLYSRMWTKVLYDLGHLSFDEPFKRLVNQGMIQGSTRYVYRINGTHTFVSQGLKDQHLVDQIRVDVSMVDGVELDTEAFKGWRPEYANAEFILENGKYICGSETEKMSKSKYNVVNPDDIVAQYGADTFRMYEMFLGPIEMSKPWDTKGIEGVHRFLKKFWRLFYDEQKGWIVTEEAASEAELKVLHKTIKKIESDTERFSFNTVVSQFMICVNELTDLNCHKRGILDALVRLITPYAPHMAEALWQQLGNEGSVIHALFPEWEEKYVTENSKVYPIAINGKPRTELEFALDAEEAFIRAEVLANEAVQKWLEGKEPKKFIYVKGRMINVVV
ncbi:leucine--tRNA ligase [Taibaiella chishuiensis]|uniref:Leucine--tRNA ligase n=1 Tax=Taibaiella chishuiensis TaxID=1434707 RepID=A0A2P8CY36_9BACT|nr:leucine--tRNA ligase [Taibaiella chishuiensis]PSK89875.1 leucyl-tRNA synthetase [Taibaiella chishuiensis]